jgi:murein L,D-transpeptidase YafK
MALAGCDADSVSPSGRALAPLSEKLVATIAEKNMDKESPILARIFKEESEMEVWKKNRDGEFVLLKTYPICKWSGDLGPKKRQGDRQAPEGFYTIAPGQMNPRSNYYLAFNTGFPNAYDRAWGYTGSELMVHGDCSSRGCYAMTDEQIQEIYALARESFMGGQREFQLQAFPFRMTALNMARHRNNSNFAFWKMLKEGYDNFEATHQEPKVAVCEKRYVFDAVAPENASKPLSFNPGGACPVYRLDPAIADAALDHRRQEQEQMANYIARGVDTVPFRTGIDGGTNPVFLAKLSTRTDDGRVYQLSATGMEAPGALPRTASVAPAPAPVKTAAAAPIEPAPSAELGTAPTAAPESKPINITGLIDNLFSKPAEAKPVAENAPLRGTSVDKRKPAAPVHIAAAPPAPAAPPKLAAPPPKAVAKTAEAKPATNPPPAPPAKKEEASQMRTAYTAAPPPSNGVLPGAQPVLSAGTFSSFR